MNFLICLGKINFFDFNNSRTRLVWTIVVSRIQGIQKIESFQTVRFSLVNRIYRFVSYCKEINDPNTQRFKIWPHRRVFSLSWGGDCNNGQFWDRVVLQRFFRHFFRLFLCLWCYSDILGDFCILEHFKKKVQNGAKNLARPLGVDRRCVGWKLVWADQLLTN